MWSLSKRIRGNCIVKLRPSFAIANRDKPRQRLLSVTMAVKNSGWSACILPKALILNAGRGRKLSSVSSDGDVLQRDVPSIRPTISALSPLAQDSGTTWCAGIGALRIDCIGQKMSFSMRMKPTVGTPMPCSMPRCFAPLLSICSGSGGLSR